MKNIRRANQIVILFSLFIMALFQHGKCEGQIIHEPCHWHSLVMDSCSFPVHQEGEVIDYRAEACVILVPVTIHSFNKKFKNLYVQLDLGANFILDLYAIPYFHLTNGGSDTANAPSHQSYFDINKNLRGTLSGYKFNLDHYLVHRKYGIWSDSLYKLSNRRLIGTVGSVFFDNKILVLDYTKNRFMVCDSFQELPQEFQRKAAYTSINRHLYNRYKRAYFNIDLGDTTLRNVLFDSGSGVFDVTTDSITWKKLTGKRPLDKANIKLIGGNSWGRTSYSIGAKVKKEYRPLSIGDEKLSNSPTIFFSSRFDPINPIIIGNNLFAGKAVVVIDFKDKKFGVFTKLNGTSR